MGDIIKLTQLTGLVYTFMFGIGGLAMLLVGPALIDGINAAAEILGFRVATAESGFFWRAMSVAMMANITLLSYLVYKDPKANQNCLPILILCKYTSAGLGLIAFSWHFVFPAEWQFTSAGTLVVLIIFTTDFPLGLWAHYLLRRLEKAT